MCRAILTQVVCLVALTGCLVLWPLAGRAEVMHPGAGTLFANQDVQTIHLAPAVPDAYSSPSQGVTVNEDLWTPSRLLSSAPVESGNVQPEPIVPDNYTLPVLTFILLVALRRYWLSPAYRELYERLYGGQAQY